MSKKVYLMLSGGVDSSVAASILKAEGFEVIGVYMKCWSKDQLEIMGVAESLYACNWEDDIQDAEIVAKKLDIPFFIWDFQTQYRQRIVDYMIAEYKIGRTPNPDVMCNSQIKFGIFYEKAMLKGADFVATGHYARIIKNELPPNPLDSESSPFKKIVIQDNVFTLDNSKLLLGNCFLAQSPDPLKDQSYFLWRIKKEQLSKTLLPIGNFKNKVEVRKYALENDLITADKKDSQGLCFIGKTSLRDLLLQTLGPKEGEIINQDGNILGTHRGAFLYTIGQRNGLGLSGGPFFVSKIDVEKNLVFVTDVEHERVLFSKKLQACSLNLLVEKEFLKLDGQNIFSCQAQTRYHQNAINCIVKLLDNKCVEVEFETEVKAIAKGQSIVLIREGIILGGAVID